MKKHSKLGLLGLGQVGLNVLAQNANQNRFNIYFIADSKNFLTKKDSSPFSSDEQLSIARSKQKGLGNNLERIRNISNLEVFKIKHVRDEISLIREKIDDPKQWTIVNASSTKLETEYQIVKSALGCFAYTTCNKTVWADYSSCSKLFDEARKRKTFLGLNCTTGVWVDQMDILPIVCNAFREGELKISKRDNSSFNLFFDSIEKHRSIKRAISELEKGGYMEPGALGLATEANDQFTKAKISANIIGKIMGIKPRCKNLSDIGLGESAKPESKDATDIAKWHNDVLKTKEKSYSALVTRMQLEGKNLTCNLDFEQLAKGNPLAKNFPGKNVILLEATRDAEFEWLTIKNKSRKACTPGNYFIHSGFGGAVRTAAKLLKEVERILPLSKPNGQEDGYPLPILCALKLGIPHAVRLESKISTHLS